MRKKICTHTKFLAATAMMLVLGFAATRAQAGTRYVVTNDDFSGNFTQNTLTFYTVEANGNLLLTKKVQVGVTGLPGGFFPAQRVVSLNAAGNQCVFASEAATGLISGVDVPTLTYTGDGQGSSNDTGLSNGIGLALNSQYLYASFTDDSVIGTFQIMPNCSLSFVGDLPVLGLQGGIVDGMAVHGNLMVVTYGDGSIESFNIGNGIPASNGDQQNSTGSAVGNSYPSAIDITRDGHFALFGDTSTAAMIEVSDISSGKLTKTVVYKSTAGVNSSNILLSPDESILYIANTQGDAVTAAFFNRKTGSLGRSCMSNYLRGYSSVFSYLSGLAVPSPKGNGGGVYVAEFGVPAGIAMIQLTVSNGTCSMHEAPGSPVRDPNSPGLLSITNFPPRDF